MRTKLALIVTSIMLATLWGCGSNRDSGGDQTSPGTTILDAANVGRDNCETCHSVGTHTGFNAFAGINSESIGMASAVTHDCEACHGGGQFHFGTGPIPYPAPDMTRCEACHAQATKVIASNHAAFGHESANCNRCHTAEGYFEFAKVVTPGATMPAIPAVTPTQGPICGACHNPVTGTMRETPNWDPNGNGVADQLDLCTSCHQTESTWQHRKNWERSIASTHIDDPATVSGTGGTTTSPIEGYVIRSNSANPCFDCHGHELKTNTGNVGRTYFAGYGADGTYYTAEDEKYYAYLKDENNESTIHTDWAQSAHAGGLLKAKYAAQDAYPKKAAAVLDGQGNVLVPANTAYDAGSDGMMSLVKAAAVTDSPVGNAWAHYPWDKTLDTVAGDRTGRADCQHCHTATGAANFLDAARKGTAYDKLANDFSHLQGWNATDGSPQNELLYCWGCHSSAETGALRATGAVPLDYKVDGQAVSLTAPDGNSGACLSCHLGRGNVNALLTKDSADSDFIAENPAATTGYKAGGTSTHYLNAGAIINQVQTRVGYTFGLPAAVPGSYADPSYYEHNTIGCAECHMTSAKSHSFAVVAKDETGAITQVVSTKCVECHDGGHGAALVAEDGPLGTAAAAAALMEEEAEGYHQALEILAEALVAAYTIPDSGYPYFIQDANKDGVITDADRVVDNPKNINGITGEPEDSYATLAPANEGHSGAMHNYSLLHHEPGAYAHNRLYAKRLIYDSLDWLDNAAMDKSVVIDAAYPHAAAWLGTTRP